MRDRLILLPGWGLGVSPLEPLAAALQGLDEHLRVEIAVSYTHPTLPTKA